MSTRTVIRVEKISKKYQLGQSGQNQTLTEVLASVGQIPHRLLTGNLFLKKREFWALKDVSFEVKKGEIVGIIGKNGAGKTTLLKILSRITYPTKGRAVLEGKVASLLGVGTGFNPELTGRENIYLNGVILGMKRREIDRKIRNIIKFSGIERFIETPVKRYSSGMRVRLAFSIAAHLEPEILLIDEVLAVGDAEFQKKSLGKMDEITKREGRTILFVSHSTTAIKQLCDRCVLLEKGRVKMIGKPNKVTNRYLKILKKSSLRPQYYWKRGIANPGIEEFKVKSVIIEDKNGAITDKIEAHKPFWIKIGYQIKKNLPYARVGFVIRNSQGITVFDAHDFDDSRFQGPRQPGSYEAKCKIPGNLLKPDKYFLSINAGIINVKNLASIPSVLIFKVVEADRVGMTARRTRSGVICPEFEWEQREL